VRVFGPPSPVALGKAAPGGVTDLDDKMNDKKPARVGAPVWHECTAGLKAYRSSGCTDCAGLAADFTPTPAQIATFSRGEQRPRSWREVLRARRISVTAAKRREDPAWTRARAAYLEHFGPCATCGTIKHCRPYRYSLANGTRVYLWCEGCSAYPMDRRGNPIHAIPAWFTRDLPRTLDVREGHEAAWSDYCQRCHVFGPVEGHHVFPISIEWPGDHDGPIVDLCGPCHVLWHSTTGVAAGGAG
jgi:hypothetical protein